MTDLQTNLDVEEIGPFNSINQKGTLLSTGWYVAEASTPIAVRAMVAAIEDGNLAFPQPARLIKSIQAQLE